MEPGALNISSKKEPDSLVINSVLTKEPGSLTIVSFQSKEPKTLDIATTRKIANTARHELSVNASPGIITKETTQIPTSFTFTFDFLSKKIKGLTMDDFNEFNSILTRIERDESNGYDMDIYDFGKDIQNLLLNHANAVNNEVSSDVPVVISAFVKEIEEHTSLSKKGVMSSIMKKINTFNSSSTSLVSLSSSGVRIHDYVKERLGISLQLIESNKVFIVKLEKLLELSRILIAEFENCNGFEKNIEILTKRTESLLKSKNILLNSSGILLLKVENLQSNLSILDDLIHVLIPELVALDGLNSLSNAEALLIKNKINSKIAQIELLTK
jgi:hypothetical protein